MESDADITQQYELRVLTLCLFVSELVKYFIILIFQM